MCQHQFVQLVVTGDVCSINRCTLISSRSGIVIYINTIVKSLTVDSIVAKCFYQNKIPMANSISDQ